MISKYLLLTILVLIMPAAVRDCFGDDAAQKAGEVRELNERLAKSGYVVQKGELIPRPGSAARTSTPLSHDQEFEVMKKGLAAAKAKLMIPDGSGVIINDGKEYYEIIIGSPTANTVPGSDQPARVMVDKKSLAVVQISGNDMKNPGDQASREVAKYRALSERLAKSEYVVVKGELTRRADSTAGPSTSLSHDQEFEVMKKGLDAAKAKLMIADGSGIIIDDGKENYEIIIGSPTPSGALGPDYTAKVLVDKKSLEVVQILAGG